MTFPWYWPPIAAIDPGIVQPGTNRLLHIQHPAAPILVTAGGGPVSIPGPIGGFVRFFVGSPLLTAQDIGDAPIISGVHQPSGMQIRRNAAVPVGGTLQLTNTVPIALEAGDTIEVTNTAGAGNDALLWYSYYDAPAAGYTVVKLQLVGPTLVTAIPAAGAGLQNHYAIVGNVPLAGTSGGGRICWYCINDDTVPMQMEIFANNNLVTRAVSINAGSTLGSTILTTDSWSTESLRLALRAAITTRSVNVFLCYETTKNAA